MASIVYVPNVCILIFFLGRVLYFVCFCRLTLERHLQCLTQRLVSSSSFVKLCYCGFSLINGQISCSNCTWSGKTFSSYINCIHPLMYINDVDYSHASMDPSFLAKLICELCGICIKWKHFWINYSVKCVNCKFNNNCFGMKYGTCIFIVKFLVYLACAKWRARLYAHLTVRFWLWLWRWCEVFFLSLIIAMYINVYTCLWWKVTKITIKYDYSIRT